MNDKIQNLEQNPNVEKMMWAKPELKELSFANTESGAAYFTEIGSTGGPS